MRLGDLQFEAKKKKPKQVKANSKKPKLIKPNKGGSSKHPYQGSLVGEASINTGVNPHKGKYQLKLKKDGKTQNIVVLRKDQINSYSRLLQDKYPKAEVWADIIEAKSKKPELPKQNNPVAKHSRNMAGAGAHKSPKDYDRKEKNKQIRKELEEAPYVVDGVNAVKTAVTKTESWLQSLYSKKNDDQLDAMSQLGELVGFTIDKRGESNNSYIFNKFFTQTEESNNKK